MKVTESESTRIVESAYAGRAADPSTSEPASNPADCRDSELDRRLDWALEETFPASDPVSIICG